MKSLTGSTRKEYYELEELFSEKHIGRSVKVRGAVHAVRCMGDITFLILRKYGGLLQCVIAEGFDADGGADAVGAPCADDRKDGANLDTGKEACRAMQKGLPYEGGTRRFVEGSTLEVTGVLRREARAAGGYELEAKDIRVLSKPVEGTSMPLPIGKKKLDTSLEAKLDVRPISLRNMRERAIFKVQEGLVRGFRDFMYSEHFTEIRTPKLVAGNAEGGANIFKLEYFGKQAFLTQSPQFYKQMMVGVYDRVFETGPVFRAEKHNTTRHLNEYTSLDFEMAYIDGFEDIMEMETAMLKAVFRFLRREYSRELEILGVSVPELEGIPTVRFHEAKELVSKKYDRRIKDPNDLEPEEEQLIGKYFKEEYGSDFVFVTHYPSKKRPFYAMDDPENGKLTLSFDLLFRGMEITTGGQRIHSYDEQVKKMLAKGMELEDFYDYLLIHKHGMPPHGGLGLGLERLTMKLLGESNVRETTMFPRDVNRLKP